MNGLELLANENNKEALLLAEAIGWLHDYRKCSDEALKTQAKIPSEQGLPRSELTNQNQFPVLSYTSLTIDSISESMSDLLNDWTGKWGNTTASYLKQFLSRCHNTSHFDKQDPAESGKQNYPGTMICTVFGNECLITNQLTHKLWNLPWNQLSNYKKDIHYKVKDSVSLLFSQVGADTRRPINEISLWDWGQLVGSLYKAAVAGKLLGYYSNTHNLRWRLLSIRFDGFGFFGKTNRISDLLARRRLLEKALDNVRDLLEIEYPLGTEIYRDENGSIFVVPGCEKDNCTLDLLALKNASGITLKELIYHEIEKNIEKEIIPKIDIDIDPWWGQDPTRRGNNELPLITDHLKPTPTFADPDWVKEQWPEGIYEDICTVCGVLPQGHGSKKSGTQDWEKHRDEKHKTGENPLECQVCKAQSRSVCQECEQRREDRSEEWAQARSKTGKDQKPWQRTIWIDEVADKNGRLALIVGKFELTEWLNGNLIETLLVICGPMFVTDDILNWPQFLSNLVRDADNTNANPGKRIFDSLSPQDGNFIRERTGGASLSDKDKSKIIKLLNKLLEHTDFFQEQDYSCINIPDRVVQLLARNRDILSKTELQELNRLLIEVAYPNEIVESRKRFITKNPSFARIERVWRTTQKFWEEMEKTRIPEILPKYHRVEIEISNKDKLTEKLGKYHAYDAEINGRRITLVWDSDTKTLVTAVMLKEGADEFRKLITPMTKIDIFEPGGYGQPRKPLPTADVKKAKVIDTPYTPIIPLLSQPSSFMMLVPASEALKVAKKISQHYELEMSKVRNRLPLLLGAVFFDDRQPFFSALDAGRRMLDIELEAKEYQVTCSCNKTETDVNHLPEHLKEKPSNGNTPKPLPHFMKWHELQLSNDENKSLHWLTSTKMGDGSTDDNWYPYVHVVKDQHDQTPVRSKQFEHPKDSGQQWVHVSDVQVGDTVKYTPSRFTWLYLNTSARRFEALDEERFHPLEELESITVLWERLKELTKTKNKPLTQSKLQAVVSLLAAKRKDWKDSPEQFKQLSESTLRKEGLKGVSLDDVNSGRLERTFELYHHILKKKVNDKNSEGDRP